MILNDIVAIGLDNGSALNRRQAIWQFGPELRFRITRFHVFLASCGTSLIQHIFPWIYLNPVRAKFFRGNINIYIYFHFVSFLQIDKTQVVEILPQIRQEPTYST